MVALFLEAYNSLLIYAVQRDNGNDKSTQSSHLSIVMRRYTVCEVTTIADA